MLRSCFILVAVIAHLNPASCCVHVDSALSFWQAQFCNLWEVKTFASSEHPLLHVSRLKVSDCHPDSWQFWPSVWYRYVWSWWKMNSHYHFSFVFCYSVAILAKFFSQLYLQFAFVKSEEHFGCKRAEHSLISPSGKGWQWSKGLEMISSSWQMQLAFQRCHQHPPTVLLELHRYRCVCQAVCK